MTELFLKALDNGEEFAKNFILNHFKFRVSINGKVLVYKPHTHTESEHSFLGIIYIDRTRIHATVIFTLSGCSIYLFDIIRKDYYSAQLTTLDLAQYFEIDTNSIPPIDQAAAILLKNIKLIKSEFGIKIHWIWNSIKTTISHVQKENFFYVPPGFSIIKPKPFLEERVSELLNEPVSKLIQTESQEIVMLQRSKLVKDQLAIVTVSRYLKLEEWRISLHFLSTSRTYICKIFDSDLFNLSEQAFDVYFPSGHIVSTAQDSITTWELIINQCTFEYRSDRDLYFTFDNLIISMRELIYFQYIHTSDQVIHFEGLLKTSFPYFRPFKPVLHVNDAKKIGITIKSFSFSRNLWVKSSFTLEQCILLLISRDLLDEAILLNTNIRYTDIQYFTAIMCRFVELREKKQMYRQKVLPELNFTPNIIEEAETYKEEHSLSSIYENDALLYEGVMDLSPAIIAAVYYNSLINEYIIKIYLPGKGLIARQPYSIKTIEQFVNFASEMLRENLKLNLGKRILQEFYEVTLRNAKTMLFSS